MAPKKVVKTNVKPVAKKAAVKKAPVAKKTVVKPAVAAAPVAQTPCSMGCGCKHGGFARFLKKLIILAIIFALGFFTCKFTCCEHEGKRFMKRGFNVEKMFPNGCLDLSGIRDEDKAEKMAEFATRADIDNDGCVTIEEFKSAKKRN